jgi:hypothetical protein
MSLKHQVCAGLLSLAFVAAAPAGSDTCIGDVTADAQVNIDDMLLAISTWGPCVGAPPSGPNGQKGEGSPPPIAFCEADIAPLGAPDGVVGIDDLLLIISGWGQCTVVPPSPGAGYVVWCEDWSTGNYSRWSSPYNNDSNPCTVAGFTNQTYVTPAAAQRSQVTCAGGVNGVHRGYGGLRFQGESVLPTFAIPSTGGIDSPYGVVIQWRGQLQVPYLFNSADDDRWMSMMTVTDDCSNAWHRVITLNIDDPTMRLRPQHVSAIQYTYGAPAFPRNQWVRVTVYVNLTTGDMHVWQNGQKIVRAWFTRPSSQTCQYHFGLYCSGANSDINYYEDDLRIIRLTQPLSSYLAEPTFPGLASTCASVPE